MAIGGGIALQRGVWAAIHRTGSAWWNWNGGVATSGNPGADMRLIGLAGCRDLIHSYEINISFLTVGALITIRMYKMISDVEREVYNQTFTQGTDPDGLWIINGTLGIAEQLRVEIFSNQAADDGLQIDDDALIEEN